MKFEPETLYHIYNQGNNRQQTFLDEEDYKTFLNLIRQYIHPHAKMVCWCLMPNHFHFIVYTTIEGTELIKQGGLIIEKLTNGIKKLLSSYARIFNKKYNRTGSLFRQKTKTINLQEQKQVNNRTVSSHDYATCSFHYIHNNPVSAGLVKNAEDWVWSSFRDYANLRKGSLVNKDLAAKFGFYEALDFKNTKQESGTNEESIFNKIRKDLDDE